MTETSTTRADFRSGAWWGTKADVNRLVELVEDLQTSASAQARQQLLEKQRATDAENDRRLLKMADAIAQGIVKRGGDARSFADPQTLLREVEVHRSMAADSYSSEARDVRDLEVKMTVQHRSWNEERTASPRILIPRLDERETVMIKLEFGKSWSETSLYLMINIGGRGCNVELRGPLSWVSSAAGQLKVELGKQSFKLGFLYNNYLLGGLGFIAGIALSVILFQNVLNAPNLVWVVLAGAVGGGLTLPVIIERSFPRFEIVQSNRHRIRALLGLGVTVALGVFVNLISKLIGL